MNSPKPRLELTSTPLFKKQGSVMMQALDVSLFDYSGNSADTKIMGPGIDVSVTLEPRRDHLFGRVLVPEIKASTQVEAQLTAQDLDISETFAIVPKKKWRIHILHFSHTDTGYTDLPSRVARNHGRFLKQILEFCRETDSYPKEAQFRWTSETGYQFLNGWERLNDAEKLEVIERIKQGRLEVAPIYLAHTSELYDYEVLHRTLQKLTGFAKEHGIGFKSGMNTDITGLPWGLVKVLASHGIRYLTTAVNATRGRAPAIPRPVWWEANDGSRVLLYNSDPKNAYIEGATMGFVDGVEKIADKLPRYLERYETEVFPYDVIGFRTAGQNADNAGPVRRVPDIIKEWNELWDFPRAISSTNGAFMEDMDQNWGEQIPSIRKAWPDWWMDTFGTVARSTAVCRVAHNKLWAGETLASVADLHAATDRYPDEEIYDALDNLTLGDEIDTCASGGVSDPDGLQSQGQLHEQHAFSYKAAITGEEVHNMGRKRFFSSVSSQKNTIQVFNSASWKRESLVQVDIPKTVLDGKSPKVLDGSGMEQAMQKIGAEGLLESFAFVAKNLAPLGSNTYTVQFIETTPALEDTGVHELNSATLENAHYRISFHQNGTLKELFDKALSHDLISKTDDYHFNELIYEATVGGRPPVSFEKMMGPKSERTIDLDFMEYAHWMFPDRFPERDTEFIRSIPEIGKIIKQVKGPVFDEITIRAQVAAVTRADTTIRLYHHLKRVDLILEMDKTEIRDAEALYVAFPFAMENFQMEVENAYSFLEPESGQMPESSKDWYLAQRFIRLWNPEMQIVWSPLEAPLVQLGGIQTGKWLHNLDLEKPTIMSWPMNNYWWTNVPASQGGWNYRFAYSLTSSNNGSDRGDAFQFGWEHHMPAEAQYFDEDKSGEIQFEGLLELSSDDVVITAIKRAENGEGLVIRLYEISGEAQSFDLVWKGPGLDSVHLVDGAENSLKTLALQGQICKLEIAPEGIMNLNLKVKPS